MPTVYNTCLCCSQLYIKVIQDLALLFIPLRARGNGLEENLGPFFRVFLPSVFGDCSFPLFQSA